MKISYGKSINKMVSTLPAQLVPVQERLAKCANESLYESPESFMQVPFDTKYLAAIKRAVQEKEKLKPTLIVLVGIGGSSLGTLAVFNALRGTRSCKQTGARLLCADTIDGRLTSELLAEVEKEWQRGGRVLLVIVSKSGTTLETLINASCCYDLTKKYCSQDMAKWVTIITDRDSVLWKLAASETFQVLEIPKKVGGRFSVFTAVGLFPLALLGIDIDELIAGARAAVQQETHEPIASVLATHVYTQYERGLHINDFFTFVPALYQCGQWWRQLIGESLGKECNGAPVGITPTVSLGTSDLHSVVQLYLAGPDERFTLFVTCEQEGEVQIPVNQFSELARLEKQNSVTFIQRAIFQGVCAAYEQKQRAFLTMTFAEISAYEVGYFLQLQMMSTVYLGELFGINVFDQPQVELYKQHTRELLGLR